MHYYKMSENSYIAVYPSAVSYHDGKMWYRGRSPALSGEPSTIMETDIPMDVLSAGERIDKTRVPFAWLVWFHPGD